VSRPRRTPAATRPADPRLDTLREHVTTLLGHSRANGLHAAVRLGAAGQLPETAARAYTDLCTLTARLGWPAPDTPERDAVEDYVARIRAALTSGKLPRSLPHAAGH